MKVYELEFHVRDSSGQTRPYDATACLILIPSPLDSLSALEKRLKDIKLPENIMMKSSHSKNVDLAEGCPFRVDEALYIKGYRHPDTYDQTEAANIFYKDRDKMANEHLKGRTYLISTTLDIDEVERRIWKHFDIGLRFTMTEEAIRDAKARHSMYGYGPGGY